MSRREETTNIPADKVEQVLEDYRTLSKANDVTKLKQADGRYTVIAIFWDKAGEA